jgi:hypothetical protein
MMSVKGEKKMRAEDSFAGTHDRGKNFHSEGKGWEYFWGKILVVQLLVVTAAIGTL